MLYIATGPSRQTVKKLRFGFPETCVIVVHRVSQKQVSRSEALHAERELLRHAGAEDAEIRDVPCGPSHEHVMHTVTVPGRSSSGKPALVLMHGYAAGSAFYFKNLLPISERYQVHAVDWLGKGLSGRVKYTAK